jgi:hypothetical protein
MITWALAALVAAARERPGYAGLWLGLGIATKYQAAFFLPLAVGLLWWNKRSRAEPVLPASPAWLADWGRFLLGLGTPLALILAWDWARLGPGSFIAAQLRGYGELRLASVAAWPSRLFAWLELGRYWPGSLVLAGLIALSGLVLLLRWFRREWPAPPPPMAMLVLAWLAGYLLLHLIINVPVWDRYLLMVVPLASLAAGWAIDGALAGAGNISLLLVVILVLALILGPAGHAAAGLLPIGGDHGLYDGIDQIAEFFAPYPYGTVLYDHWLSWQLRYYLFDSRVYVSWFADSAVLQEDLRVFGDRSLRFLIVPAWQESAPLRSAVAAAGFRLAPAFSAYRPDGSTSFVVYQIIVVDPG